MIPQSLLDPTHCMAGSSSRRRCTINTINNKMPRFPESEKARFCTLFCTAWNVPWMHRCMCSVPGLPKATWKLDGNSKKENWRKGGTFLCWLYNWGERHATNTPENLHVPVLFYIHHQVETTVVPSPWCSRGRLILFFLKASWQLAIVK